MAPRNISANEFKVKLYPNAESIPQYAWHEHALTDCLTFGQLKVEGAGTKTCRFASIEQATARNKESRQAAILV